MKTIIFNYRSNVYHVIEEGKLPKIIPMTPRAAAHVAVILVAAGWQVQHEGLTPTPQLDRDAIAQDINAITPPVQNRSIWDKKPIEFKDAPSVEFPPNTLSVTQAAERLGCSIAYIYQLLSRGAFASERIYQGSKALHAIPSSEIEAYLAKRDFRKKNKSFPLLQIKQPTAAQISERVGQTDTVNVPEAADLLDVPEATIYKLIYTSRLPAYKAPSGKQGPDRYYIKISDLLTFADQAAEQA